MEYQSNEQHLREIIASQIEARYCVDGIKCYGVNGEHCETIKELANIVRGIRDNTQ